MLVVECFHGEITGGRTCFSLPPNQTRDRAPNRSMATRRKSDSNFSRAQTPNKRSTLIPMTNHASRKNLNDKKRSLNNFMISAAMAHADANRPNTIHGSARTEKIAPLDARLIERLRKPLHIPTQLNV